MAHLTRCSLGLSAAVLAGMAAVVGASPTSAQTPPPPTVTALSPKSGPVAGGTVVTITGTSFLCGAPAPPTPVSDPTNSGVFLVLFGNTTSPSFTVDSDTQITATAPAGSAGPVDVTVSNPCGASTKNPPADTYTYGPTSGTAAPGPTADPGTNGSSPSSPVAPAAASQAMPSPVALAKTGAGAAAGTLGGGALVLGLVPLGALLAVAQRRRSRPRP
jgi:hypothetical protein